MFFEDYQTKVALLIAVVAFLPGIIGVFWGAPLITRELEHGTHRLVWNQSITRVRWLAVKLVLIGGFALVVTGLAALAVGWWSDPVDQAGASNGAARISPSIFLARGVVPMGYAAFAFVLGVTVGVLVRRTLPTMAITLVVFIAMQVGMPMLVRPHLIPTKTATFVITAQNHGDMMLNRNAGGMLLRVEAEPEKGAWTLQNSMIDKSGRTIKDLPLTGAAADACAPRPAPTKGEPPEGPPGPPQECFDYLAKQGYRERVVYHPADHFWPLQWAETGLYAVLTLGLAGFCFYRTRRNIS
jgi:hypothetical protein